jgi:hypothetical protein
VLLIITDNDRPAPQDESDALYRHAREPKRPVVLSGFIHCEVYGDAAFRQVMAAKWLGLSSTRFRAERQNSTHRPAGRSLPAILR